MKYRNMLAMHKQNQRKPKSVDRNDGHTGIQQYLLALVSSVSIFCLCMYSTSAASLTFIYRLLSLIAIRKHDR